MIHHLDPASQRPPRGVKKALMVAAGLEGAAALPFPRVGTELIAPRRGCAAMAADASWSLRFLDATVCASSSFDWAGSRALDLGGCRCGGRHDSSKTHLARRATWGCVLSCHLWYLEAFTCSFTGSLS